MGSWVYGLEGDVEVSDVNGNNVNWPFGDNSTAKISAQGSIRGRVGYATGANLFYVTGGLALADIKTAYYGGSAKDSYSHGKAGWTVGGGIERAFGRNWTARVEYRYSDFGRVTDWTKTTDTRWNEHNDITENAIRVGFTYKFH